MTNGELEVLKSRIDMELLSREISKEVADSKVNASL